VEANRPVVVVPGQLRHGRVILVTLREHTSSLGADTCGEQNVAAVSLREGDVVMRREVVRGAPHLIYPVRVVEDAGDRLTVFLASGTPISSAKGSWPWSDEGHPWAARGRWQGHGVLQMLSAVEPFSTWVFWKGEERSLHFLVHQSPRAVQANARRHRLTRPGAGLRRLRLMARGRRRMMTCLTCGWRKAAGAPTRLRVSGRSERGWRRDSAQVTAGGTSAGHRGSPRHIGSHGPKRILTRDAGHAMRTSIITCHALAARDRRSTTG
jgi:hypothetical protein